MDSQQAIHFVSQAIASGDIDIGIGCGIEMMSIEKMGKDFRLFNFPSPKVSKVSGSFVKFPVLSDTFR